MNRIDTLLSRYFWVLPVVYLFVAIFLLRSQVGYVYLASGLLIALTIAAHHYGRKAKPEIRLARWLVVLAAIGITASFILSIEKIVLLTEPSRVASCSLSPVVACSPVIASWQASAFGLPNSFIGIFAYTAVFTAAMTIAAGAIKLTRACGGHCWLAYCLARALPHGCSIRVYLISASSVCTACWSGWLRSLCCGSQLRIV